MTAHTPPILQKQRQIVPAVCCSRIAAGSITSRSRRGQSSDGISRNRHNALGEGPAKDYWKFMTPCIVEEEYTNPVHTVFPKIHPNPSSPNSSLLNEFAEELKRSARRSNERGTTE